MSQEDFNAGRRGETFQQGMSQMSYEAGLAKFKKEQASGISAPKIEVDGPGFTMFLMAPLLALMYPVAGVITIGSLALVNGLIAAFFQRAWMFHAIASLVVFFVALFGVGLKAEHAASRVKMYRVSRHIFRLLPICLAVLAAMTKTYSGKDAEAAGAGIFVGLMVIGVMLWLFPKFDRLWFPVMDGKAKKEAQKYEGKNEDEIWQSKNLEWRNKKRFFLIWLGLTVGLTVIFHKGIPFILLALASYLACFFLRSKFAIKPEKKESVTPEPEWVRSER